MCARHVAKTNRAGSDSDFFKYIGLIAAIAAAVAVSMIILNFIELGISFSSGPLFYVVLIDVGLVAFVFFLVLSGNINRNNLLRFGSIALAVMIIFINLFVESYISAADQFINDIFSTQTRGAVEYSVVAQRSAGIDLESNSSLRTGIQSTDDLRAEAESEIQKLANVSFTEFENPSLMISATEDHELDIAVIKTALLQSYAEYFPDEFENLDVLTTFRAGSTVTATNGSNGKIDITKPFIIYVCGLDDFGDIDNMNARSDVNMLVCIDPERYKILLINTPRDYYVQLHGTTGTRDKLSHAGVYGVGTCKATIEDLYGVEANYQALINFDTIVQLCDSMGGILVDNPRTFELWGQTYEEGNIWLNGDMALLFSRARKGLEGGDIDRAANQQLVIQGIVDRLTDPKMIVNYKSILGRMSAYFRSNIPSDVYIQLFSRQIELGGDWTIEKMVAQGNGAMRPTYSMGSTELSVLLPDETSLNEIRTAISNFMNRVD